MKKIKQLFQEYKDLENQKEMKYRELYTEPDGFRYITNTRCYGANTYEEHKNYFTVMLLCSEYYGDNGIVDVYTNNPLYKKEEYLDNAYNENDECNPDIIFTYGDIEYLNDKQIEKLDTRDVSMSRAICNVMADMLTVIEPKSE